MKNLVSFVIKNIPRKYLQLFAHHGLKVASLFYIGKGSTCNVCGKSFRKFMPYGRKPPRENALCPNCLTLERHRLMWEYLKEKTDFFTAKHKVLHVAPELCFIKTFEGMKNLDYVTADLESPLAKVKADVQNLPFEDNSFDVAFCNHVMEHVDDDIKAMSELCRVLRPGGWAIIQSPQDMSRAETYEDPTITDPKAREEAFWQSDHVRLFGRDYGKRLEKAGFKVTEDDFVKKLDPEKVKLHAFPSEEIIYFCQKP
ncbi:SAM-dependent methyltransferase [Fulvitalea axinellae]|uniref:SAM-dependent methyltransferase n=1 Tax=Fulvitalea axinellae TaxID=1182444 RepID=A0AAU9CWX6_9BACT|nr:SAM-dependent methyltransferase [Fulvitalea axinellae]